MGVAQTTIGYCHEVSHRENRALVKLLGLELRKIKTVREVGRVDFLALVDAHEVDPELPDGDDYEVLTIVDHHRPATPPKARFVDMRMDVGATATIFVEYLMELAALDPDIEEDRRIATALMHGLSTDTDDFMLARAADFRGCVEDRRGLRSRSPARPLPAAHRADGDGRHRARTDRRSSSAATSRWPASAS